MIDPATAGTFPVRRLLVAAIALVAATVGLGSWSPSVVLAHAALVGSTPAASSVLEVGPPLVVLDFDEGIDAPLSSIELFDADRRSVPLGRPEQGADGSIVEATAPAIDEGTYAVVWRVSSADGHVVTGAFSFQVGTGSSAAGAALIEDVAGGVRAEPEVGRLLGVARFAAFVGLAVLFGGLAMVRAASTATDVVRATRRLLWIGWVLLGAATALNFGLLGANAVGGGLGDALDTSLWGDLADARTGRLLLVRLVLWAMTAALLIGVRQRSRTWWEALVPVLGVLTVCTFSGSGHPSVTTTPWLWMAVDALHLALVAGWVGGLVMIGAGGRVWLRDDPAQPAHGAAVRWFSRLATIGVPLIVVTGVLQAWRLGGGLSTLTETTWGRVLLVKGTVVVLVVTVGAGSRWLLRNDGPAALRRTVLAETILGVAVLGLAAGMVGVPPQAAARSEVFAATLAEGGVIVEVSLTPGHVGANQVHVVVIAEGGSVAPMSNLVARMSLPSEAIPDIPVALVAESPNHYSGDVTLAFSGDWTLELVVSPEPTQSILLTTVVSIP